MIAYDILYVPDEGGIPGMLLIPSWPECFLIYPIQADLLEVVYIGHLSSFYPSWLVWKNFASTVEKITWISDTIAIIFTKS